MGLFCMIGVEHSLLAQQSSHFSFKIKAEVNGSLVESNANPSAYLTLTSVPRELFPEGDLSKQHVLAWQPANTLAVVRYSAAPGNRVAQNYPNVMQAQGTGKLTLNPGKEGLTAGIYYCIVVSESDPTVTSLEFRVIVQANATARIISPLGNISLQQGAPLFRWDPVVGVPYYFVFLSEGPISIERDQNDKIVGLSGLNLIWQVITAENFLVYGEADLAGNFPNKHIPPLIPGIEYNWVVLNSYGPNPDLISGDVAPVAPSFFSVTRPVLADTPSLLFPLAEIEVADEVIDFEWSPVADAARYRLFLYEQADFQDNLVKYIIWSRVTSATNSSFNARNLLINTKYSWRVIAEDNTGKIGSSALRSFNYTANSGEVKFQATSSEGRLSRVSIEVVNEMSSAALLPVVTDTSGSAYLTLPSGNYNFTASRPGFPTTNPAGFTIQSNQRTIVPFEIQRGAAAVSGNVIGTDNIGVFNATVEIISGSDRQIVHTDENGYFTHALSAGLWKLRAYKKDFVVSDFQTFRISVDEIVDAGTLQLAPANNSIDGQAKFAAAGRAFQGGTVTASNGDISFELITNSQGGFRFNLGPGTWRITINAQGYFATPSEYSLNLVENQQTPVTFQLFEGGIVNGRAAFNGFPVENAEVRALSGTGKNAQSDRTNTQGNFTLGLETGEYELIIAKAGLLPAQRNISVKTGETSTELFELSAAGMVTGKVRNIETAMAMAGVKVFVVNDTSFHTLTDDNGAYTLSLPPDIPLELNLSFPGFVATNSITVTTTAGQTLSGQDFFLQALSGVISGRVTDGFAPIDGVRVYIISLEMEIFTDKQGRFEVEIAPGTYAIEFSKDCHFLKTETVLLVAGESKDLDVRLNPLSSAVLGEVRNSTGNPLADAKVSAIGDTIFSSFSNESGVYELCLSGGIFRIVAEKSGYFKADTILVINDGDLHAGVNFFLQESFASLHGFVVDSSGAPVSDAIVNVKNHGQTLAAKSGSNGAYEVKQILPGESQIRAVLNGAYGMPQTVLLEPLEEMRRDLVLYPADGFIRGRVVDAQNDAGIFEASISAQFKPEPDLAFSIVTDVNGDFSLDGLPVIKGENYSVFAFKQGYFSPAPALNIRPGSNDVDFSLVSKVGMIAGIVQNFDTGKPVADARVEGVNRSGGRSIAFSDTSGRFQLLKLVPSETYNISVQKVGYFAGGVVNISAGDTTVSIDLLRKYGFVKGVLKNMQTGQPMFNTPVQATPLGLTGELVEVKTNLSGEYLLRLIPDFYKVAPALSHFRSEPEFAQHEVAELDTLSDVDFSLQRQTVQTIIIQRADQKESPTIPNAAQHCYVASARDANNREVRVEAVQWDLNVSGAAAKVDENGCVEVAPAYFGDLEISVKDIVSGVRGELDLQVFARVDSNSQITLFDDRGLQLRLTPKTVKGRNELLVSRVIVTPAKRGRAQYLTSNYAYSLKPDGLAFSGSAKLILPPPPNTDGQKRYIALWNGQLSEWKLIATSDRGKQLEAIIIETGEYVSLSLSKGLAIENFILQPNPFSPMLETNGAPGLQINFDLSSSMAPTPLLTVKIYNMEGDLVRLLHEQTPFPRGLAAVNWDGKTDNGAYARNGRYIVRVTAEDPGNKRNEMKSVILIK